MAYKRRQVWTGIEGIPPAPLIGEQLTSIDFDFMRTKSIISKEIPLLTMAELAEEPRKTLPVDSIIGQLMIAGFHNAATEIRELIREDASERQIAREKRECIPTSTPLGEDLEKLTLLSTIFCEQHGFAESRQWNKVIISRLELAEILEQKYEDSRLSVCIANSCFKFLAKLNQTVSENRVIIAEVHLTKAYFLMMEHEVNLNELHKHLQKCFEMLGDHKDKKMYSVMAHKGSPKREGTIRIAIKRPVALHGWHNYENVATVNEIVTLRNTSLYRMACIISTLSLLKDVQRHIRTYSSASLISIISSSEHNDIQQSHQQTFVDAITFANEGENSSCIFHALYTFGSYLNQQGLYNQAYNVFRQLKTKSQNVNDYETLGIANSNLGVISKHKHVIPEAMEHLGEEWEIGHTYKLQLLRIDALMELGKLLLEEGQVVKAEKLGAQAYDELFEIITQAEKTPKRNGKHPGPEKSEKSYDFKYDNMSEKSWVMAGVMAGQQRWARFAGQCRGRGHLYSVISWQTSRTPLPPVLNDNIKRPVTITSCKRHHDLDYLSNKLWHKLASEIDDDNANKKKRPTQKWLDEIDDKDNYEFMHDQPPDEIEETPVTSTADENFDIFDSDFELDEEGKIRRRTYLGIAAALQEIYSRQRSLEEKNGEVFKRPSPELSITSATASSGEKSSAIPDDELSNNGNTVEKSDRSDRSTRKSKKRIDPKLAQGENENDEEEEEEEEEDATITEIISATEQIDEDGSEETSSPVPTTEEQEEGANEEQEEEQTEEQNDGAEHEQEEEEEEKEEDEENDITNIPEDTESITEQSESGSSNYLMVPKEIKNDGNLILDSERKRSSQRQPPSTSSTDTKVEDTTTTTDISLHIPIN